MVFVEIGEFGGLVVYFEVNVCGEFVFLWWI